jgi:hypothetical protein
MKSFFAVLLVLVIFALPKSVRADVAPPAQPPGANLEPGGETTQVRMIAEKVLIEVKPGNGDSLGQAVVTADFTMRNLGDSTETMAVRFPISANDGFSSYPEIKNLQVQVDGRSVRTGRILGEDPYYGGDQVPWAEFQAKFPLGKDVKVRVTYQLEGTGYPPFASFNYILSTGAGWKDTIGSADVVVKLPYEANTDNVLLAGETGYSFTSPGAVLDGREIRWHFENLEPTTADNLEVELVMPAKWQKVLKEQDNVTRDPNDGEAWGRLGKLYKEIAFLPKELRPDPGGQALYDLSIQAYEKCLELRPNDAEWHAGFAELYYWHYNVSYWNDQGDDTDLKQALDLLKKAIEINSKTLKAVEMLDEIAAFYPGYVEKAGDQYVFIYLKATPEISPSQTAESTPVPTNQIPTAAPTETEVSPTLPPTRVNTPTDAAVTAAPQPATATLATSSTASPATTPAATSGKTRISLCGAAFLPILVGVLLPLGYRRRKGRVR